MRNRVPVFILAFLLPFSANAATIACLKTTGQHFCLTQKAITADSIQGSSSVVVTAENHYGCEPFYTTRVVLEAHGAEQWLSEDGKKSLSITKNGIRFEDKDLIYAGEGDEIGGMTPFYFLSSSCN